MNTQSLILTALMGFLSLNAQCLETPGIALPSKQGRLTQLGDAKFIDLNKVTLIVGEINITVKGESCVFPLSEKGRQEAISYLKAVLKNPPSPSTAMVYVPTTPSVSASIRFDEILHTLYQNKKPLATEEIESVDKTFSESIAYLKEILEMCPRN